MLEVHRRICRLVALAVCTPLVTPLPANAQEIVVSRYSTVRALPSVGQINLLEAIVTERFGESIETVGGAIAHLLRTTGYRLAQAATADSARADLLRLPLPTAHRELGPLTVQTALETLAGPAFRLVVDPVHRLISFERCGSLPMDAAIGSAAASK